MRTDLAYDGENLWQIAGHPKKIVILDPQRGKRVSEISLRENREHACGLSIQDNMHWVAHEHIGSIVEHERESNRILTEYNVLPQVAGLEIVGNTLWYAEYEQSLLVGIDLLSDKEVQSYRIPGNPTGLC